jgi:hypothetical protein
VHRHSQNTKGFGGQQQYLLCNQSVPSHGPEYDIGTVLETNRKAARVSATYNQPWVAHGQAVPPITAAASRALIHVIGAYIG